MVIGSSPNVRSEEERLLNRRITIKINKAKYCIALINSQILNYQPINSVCLDKQ